MRIIDSGLECIDIPRGISLILRLLALEVILDPVGELLVETGRSQCLNFMITAGKDRKSRIVRYSPLKPDENRVNEAQPKPRWHSVQACSP